MSHAPDEVFGYGDARGSTELRDALADYLGRARGVDTDPARLLVCNGFTQALTLICCTLRTTGATTLAVEDPGARRYRQLAEAAGLHVVAVACDQDGLRVDRLPHSGVSAILVTPAHQYPLGVTMSPARRIALVEWARRHQALIIEDDYDGEFRYDRQPVGVTGARRAGYRPAYHEPRLALAVADAYGLPGPATTGQLTEISENWRPYRTWVTLLLRTQQEIRAAGALSWG